MEFLIAILPWDFACTFGPIGTFSFARTGRPYPLILSLTGISVLFGQQFSEGQRPTHALLQIAGQDGAAGAGIPGGPGGPGGLGGPAAPWSPGLPIAPTAPGAPLGPLGPWIPEDDEKKHGFKVSGVLRLFIFLVFKHLIYNWRPSRQSFYRYQRRRTISS